MKSNKDSSETLNQIWKFFTSVKLTVVILLLLAATSIIGTLIPQNENLANYLKVYGEVLYRFFYMLDIFDMYHSWWFQLLIVLLMLNIVICSLNRFPMVWKIVSAKKPSFSLSRFRRLSRFEEFSDSRSPDELTKKYERYISKKFSYSKVETTDKGFFIFAEKGSWTRLGVYGVHLSVVILLVGALIGSIFGFDGYVNIPEGGTVDRIRLQKNNKILPLGFKIRCDNFNVSFYDSGTPKEFRSSLTILEQDKTILQKDIIVNDPLRYKSISMFQSSYGSMSPQNLVLTFTKRDTDKVYRQRASIGQLVNMPETAGTITITEYISSYEIKGFNVGEVFVGTLNPAEGESMQVVLPLRFPTYDKTRKGKWIISVDDYEQRYYTGLQVTKDPGVGVVYTGFALMIMGCFIAFFMPHQKVGIEVMYSTRSSKIKVSGTANKNKMGMQKKMQKIAEDLADLK